MTTLPIRKDERDIMRVSEAVSQLQQGRSNAHGTFTLNDGETSTTVTAPTCSENSCVNVMPKTAHAAASCQDETFYIVPGNGSFVVHHTSTAEVDCDFHYSING
jgi:hypothetical protein